jgi:hypothetical protein
LTGHLARLLVVDVAVTVLVHPLRVTALEADGVHVGAGVVAVGGVFDEAVGGLAGEGYDVDVAVSVSVQVTTLSSSQSPLTSVQSAPGGSHCSTIPEPSAPKPSPSASRYQTV